MEVSQPARPSEPDTHKDLSLGKTNFEKQLNSIIEDPDKRHEMAENIIGYKRNYLILAGIANGYTDELTETKEGTVFAHPEKIEEAKIALVAKLHETKTAYREAQNKESARQAWEQSFALIAALTELTILGPEKIQHTINLLPKNPHLVPGVQIAQIDAALAIATGHSSEVDSGQGKSVVDIPIAAVARHLLLGDQVHLMVLNPQAKERDTENLQKLTQALGLGVETFTEDAESAKEYALLKDLVAARTAITYAANITAKERNAFRRRMTLEIERLADKRLYRTRRRDLAPKKDAHPAIVIGDDKDFVFLWLGKRDDTLWQKEKTLCIADEGDVSWEAPRPFALENPEVDILEASLPDWLVSCATDSICEQMFKEHNITLDKDGYVFVNEDGEEQEVEFLKRLSQKVQQMRETGRLGGDAKVAAAREQAVIRAMEGIFKRLPEEFRLSAVFNDVSVREIIRAYTKKLPIPDTDNILWTTLVHDYQYAWQMSKKLVAGTQYETTPGSSVVIDELTGHPMESHRFTGMTDIMVEARENICNLTSRGAEAVGTTGFYHFVDQVYGLDRMSLVSGTLSHMASEIEGLTGKPLIVTERWIGEALPIPQHTLEETYAQAQKTLEGKYTDLTKAEKPVAVICANDRELLELKETFDAWQTEQAKNNASFLPYKILVVTSKTSLVDEAEVYRQAGDIRTIIFANPRAGRMVDITTTREADERGGLHVVVWGAHTNNAVLRQIVSRAARVGHPGSASWVVYKTGGRLGLLDMSTVSSSTDLTEKVSNLKPGLFDYEDSVVEKIHRRHTQNLEQIRLGLYLRDRLHHDLQTLAENEALGALTINKLPLVSRRYAQTITQTYVGSLLTVTADGMARIGTGIMTTYGDFEKAYGGKRPEISRAYQEPGGIKRVLLGKINKAKILDKAIDALVLWGKYQQKLPGEKGTPRSPGVVPLLGYEDFHLKTPLFVFPENKILFTVPGSMEKLAGLYFVRPEKKAGDPDFVFQVKYYAHLQQVYPGNAGDAEALNLSIMRFVTVPNPTSSNASFTVLDEHADMWVVAEKPSRHQKTRRQQHGKKRQGMLFDFFLGATEDMGAGEAGKSALTTLKTRGFFSPQPTIKPKYTKL